MRIKRRESDLGSAVIGDMMMLVVLYWDTYEERGALKHLPRSLLRKHPNIGNLESEKHVEAKQQSLKIPPCHKVRSGRNLENFSKGENFRIENM